MKRIKKSKIVKIHDALEKLNKAVNSEDPHIRISLPWAVQDDDRGRGKEFISSLKTFVDAYKKYYELEKIELDLIV